MVAPEQTINLPIDDVIVRVELGVAADPADIAISCELNKYYTI